MKSKIKAQTEPDWRRVAELYEEAQNLSPEDRLLWLTNISQSNPIEYLVVQSLLEESIEVGDFLEKPVTHKVKLTVVPKQLPDFKKNEVLSSYTIEGVLGVGGSAKVYLAKDNRLGRQVAIKVFFDQSNEARTLASLEHDNIVKVYAEEVMEVEGLRLIIMQLIPGPSLDIVFRKLKANNGKNLSGGTLVRIIDQWESPYLNPFNPELLPERNEIAAKDYVDAILCLGMKICDALKIAHSQNVLHLDVKPGNIILSQFGRPFLTDFGVSLTSKMENGLTCLGGTPRYMSPEQIAMFETRDTSLLNPATDLYSLGIVLKEFLSLPVREEFQDRLYLDWVMTKATDESSINRYANAEAFKSALCSVQEIRQLKKTVWENNRANWLTKHPLLTLTLIGAIPQLCAIAIGTLYNAVRIVNALTPAQGQLFRDLNVTLTPIISILVTAIWIGALLKIRPYITNPLSYSNRPETVFKLRQYLLKIPRWGILVTTLGWLPTAALYPLTLHLLGGGISREIACHFVASFTLSWLITLSYCYVLHTFICIKLLYKEFWYGCTHVQANSVKELSEILSPVRVSLIMIIVIPLMASILVLMTGRQEVSQAEWRLSQLLITSLILLGVFGICLALTIGQSLLKTLIQFKGQIRN